MDITKLLNSLFPKKAPTFDYVTGETVTHTYYTKKGLKQVLVPTKVFRRLPEGKYFPHQGEQERARRRQH